MRSTTDFLIGIAVGVGVGMLTAPRPGKESREQLMNQLNKLKEEGGSGNWMDKANEVIDSVKSQANQLMGKAEEKGEYNQQVNAVADDTKQGVDKVAVAVKMD